LFSSAQTVKNNQQLNIPHTTGKASIDGELTDPIWNNALSISLDIVNSPWNNLSSPVKTEAKIIENGEFIYISFMAYDPEPNKIKGFLADRDTTWSGDLVGIKLDTFNSRQLNYNFLVNPYGVQNDSIRNEVTGEDNRLWDGNWHSYGKKTSKGFQVEIAIPYNILNFDESNSEKTWAIEFLRLYPRDEHLRISHIPLNRDNNCWLCQIPEIKGFEKADIGKNILVTPTIVASSNQSRDVYTPNDPWSKDNNVDAGVDIRWGPNANTLLNATVNPDFSAVESDAGQLNVNETFSLFYDEKRSFFLENSDYFSSNYNLVYTRNIAAPDYGVKLTSRTEKYSYGLFVTNDTETNFIVPGNISGSLASLQTKSHSAAFNYRYNISDELTLGIVSTLRTADNYHNAIAGFDAKYRFDDSNTVTAQILHSDTEYPIDLFNDFTASQQAQFTGRGEQALRTKIEDGFNDQAYKVNFDHNSEYWEINAGHQKINSLFRADLGFMNKVDYQKNNIDVDRLFYGDEDDIWSEAKITGSWENQKNEAGEFIAKTFDVGGIVEGPKLSYLSFNFIQATKVGLRHNDLSLAIDNNTTQFDEKTYQFYAEFQPTNRVFTGLGYDFGDKIDYRNNRLGQFNEIYVDVSFQPTDHLNIGITHTYSELDATPVSTTIDDNVFKANLTNLKVSYQFDVKSYLKLSVVYTDIDKNVENNPFDSDLSPTNKDLSTQLIYSYKLNPQTVFFVGYSDNSYQDYELKKVSRAEKTFFSKVSYAWSL
jgi:hypothetical protein